MSFPGSYERQERFTSALTYVLAVLFYAAAYGLAWLSYGPVAGFVVCSPILGAYGAWWFLHRGVSMRHWFRWLVLRKINGNYHAFDGVAVRIRWSEGRCLVAMQDVFTVLREELDALTTRRLATSCGEDGFLQDENGDWWFAESALLQWLDRHGTPIDRRKNQFKRWLEREAFAPMHRRQEHKGPASAALR